MAAHMMHVSASVPEWGTRSRTLYLGHSAKRRCTGHLLSNFITTSPLTSTSFDHLDLSTTRPQRYRYRTRRVWR